MGPLDLNVVFTIITSEYMTSHKRADIIVQKYEFDFGTAGLGCGSVERVNACLDNTIKVFKV